MRGKKFFVFFTMAFILSSLLMISCGGSSDSENEEENSGNGSSKLIDTFANHYKISDTSAYDTNKISPTLTFDDGIQTQNGFIMVGSIQVDPKNKNHRGKDGAIVGFDSNANPVWVKYVRETSTEKKVTIDRDEKFYKIIKLSNGNYVAISEDHLSGGGGTPLRHIIVSFSSDGNILWAKSFGRGENLPIKDIIPLSDGFLAVGNTWVHYDSYRGEKYPIPFDRKVGIIIKFDNNGDVVFAKFYANPNVYYYPPYNYYIPDGADWEFNTAVQLGDYIYIGGISYNNINTDLWNSGLLVKITNNGNFVWAKHYDYFKSNKEHLNHDYIESMVAIQDSIILDHVYIPEGTVYYVVHLIKTDINGNIQKAVKVGDSTYYTYFEGIDVGKNDSIYISTLQTSFMKFDSNLNPLLNFSAVDGWQYGEFPTNDGGGIGISEGYPPTSPFVVKVNGNYKTCLAEGHYHLTTDTTELNKNMPAVDKNLFKIKTFNEVYSEDITSSIEIYETIETGIAPAIKKEEDKYCNQK